MLQTYSHYIVRNYFLGFFKLFTFQITITESIISIFCVMHKIILETVSKRVDKDDFMMCKISVYIAHV
jgi:hypothetical protein